MYKHLLVPTDGTELSNRAVTEAAQLAKQLSAKVTLFYVQADYPLPIVGEAALAMPEQRADYLRNMAAQAESVLKDASKIMASHGVATESRTVVSDTPWQIIINTAEAERCDLVFMASHGRRGLASLLIGSETQKVLTHCKIPVLVYR